MAKQLTREEYLMAVAKPKRRFQVLALGSSRSVQLRTPVSAPCYWFEREEVYEEDGKYTVDPDQASISLIVDGMTSVLFYLKGSHIDTCTFAFNLNRAQLEKAVAAMRRAKLTRLIPEAASYAVENLPPGRRDVLAPELRKLLSSRSKKTGRRK